jgi:hypothetical protein
MGATLVSLVNGARYDMIELWSATGANDMAKRSTMRSSKGTKLYAKRDKKGKFKDIQSYKRAHGRDIKRQAKGE